MLSFNKLNVLYFLKFSKASTSTDDEEDKEKDLGAVDELAKWIEKQQNLTRLASQESVSSGTRRRTRRRSSYLETVPSSQEELKANCTKKATELLIEGLKHLIKLHPTLAEDDSHLRTLIRQIKDGKPIDVPEFLQKVGSKAPKQHFQPDTLNMKTQKRKRVQCENEPAVNVLKTIDKNANAKLSQKNKPTSKTPKDSTKKAKRKGK
mgnify:FL=1